MKLNQTEQHNFLKYQNDHEAVCQLGHSLVLILLQLLHVLMVEGIIYPDQSYNNQCENDTNNNDKSYDNQERFLFVFLFLFRSYDVSFMRSGIFNRVNVRTKREA